MKKQRLILLVATLAVLLPVLLGACGSPSTPNTPANTPPANQTTNTPQPGQVLKVGVMTPSTGPAAEKGAPGGHGILDAFEYINKELGGAAGYPIQPIWRDSAYDMQKIPTIVNDFINEGCLMFTTHASAEMTAAMTIANRAEFPGMATFTSQSIYHPPAHIYGQMPDYGDDWIAFATYYMKNVWKDTTRKPKMALHLLANSTGYGARDGARAMADKLGIELIWPPAEHKATTLDESTSLIDIKAKNPDVLFISSTPAPTAVILKDARRLGLTNIVIGTAHASFTKALIDLAGKDDAGNYIAEGVYGVFPTVTWEDNVPGIAKATEYVQKNNSKDYGNMDYLSTWTSALIVREILTNAVNAVGYDVLAKGDVNAWRAIEKNGIQKLNGYKVEGLQGPVTYTPGDNRLSKSLRLYKVTGGKITQIQDWTEAPDIKYEEFDWFGK